jgi:uncharacterized protein (DUF427 family)
LYLSGKQLQRHQTIVQQYRIAAEPQIVSVLRADHRVYVRHFSEDAERCLVIDQQTQRRMATYDYERQSRLHTQDLGESTLVVEMLYDLRNRRWKIEGNHYFPESSLNRQYVSFSNHRTSCPWKGQAHYYSLFVDGSANPDAVWYYPEPSEAAANIKGRVAFWKGVQVE